MRIKFIVTLWSNNYLSQKHLIRLSIQVQRLQLASVISLRRSILWLLLYVTILFQQEILYLHGSMGGPLPKTGDSRTKRESRNI